MCGTHVEQEIIPGLANKAGKFTKVVYTVSVFEKLAD